MTFGSIVGAILVLAACVLLHELGHFVSALALGIPVEEFSIGFGPRLVQFRFRGIRYSLRLIFLGGYVRYAMDESDVVGAPAGPAPDAEDAAAGHRTYLSQPAWRRFISVLCGPLMNFVLAFAVAVALYATLGNPMTVPRIAQYATDSAAYAAGIQPGDIIVAVDGSEVSYDTDGAQRVVEAIAACGGQALDIAVERGGERVELSVTPAYDSASGRYMIGVTFGTAYSPCSPGEALSRAGSYLVNVTNEMYRSLGSLFTSSVPIDEQLTGPVGTVQIISENVQRGGLDTLNIIMIISLNFGILNLLPIPGLDGSKLVFLIIEMIRRKPIAPSREAVVNLIGLALLFGLMIFVTYKDVAKLITG